MKPKRGKQVERPPLTVRAYPDVAPGSPTGPAESRDWELMLFGDLTDQHGELTERLVDVPRRSRGTIYFDSCGGSVFAGLTLASLIRLRGLKPVAVVTGECSSAALLPFAACEQRLVTPHCSLLFHPMRWHSEENVRLEEAAEWARQFRVMESDMDGLLGRLFDLPRELIQQWSRPGRFLSGSELVEAGIARMVDLFSGDVWSQLGKQSLPR